MASKRFRQKQKGRAPVPTEAVLTKLMDPAGNQWEIVPDGPFRVDHKHRQVHVPADDRESVLRAMTQIRHGNPNVPDGVDPALFSSLDTARVGKSIGRHGQATIGLSESDCEAVNDSHWRGLNERRDQAKTEVVQSGSGRKAVAEIVKGNLSPSVISSLYEHHQSKGVPVEQLNEWYSEVVKANDLANDLMGTECDDHRTTGVVAKFLEEHVPEFPKPAPPAPPGGFDGDVEKAAAKAEERGDSGPGKPSEAEKAMAEILDEMMGEQPGTGGSSSDAIKARLGIHATDDASDHTTGDERFPYVREHWSRTIVEEFPPLNRNTLLKKTKRGRKRSDEGVIPKNVHRLTTDKRIFERKRKEMGGSLLIDDSGSMSFTHEQLDRLIELAPYSEVRIYSGNANHGVIKRLAMNGKRTDDIGTPHGGNDCDGVALDWLSKQPEPRVWVSDGMSFCANPPGEASVRYGINECAAMSRRHRILRVPTFDAAIEFFESIR